MAEAFRNGRLGVMDYYNMQNVMSDTRMRDAISLLDDISLPNVLEEVKNGEQVTVVCGGRTFKADCEVSDRQRGALLAGGTLNYARQNAK